MRMRGVIIVLLGVGVLAEAGEARAACTGASPNWSTTADASSFVNCYTNSKDGDTITIGAGSFILSNGFTISKGIRIQGAGIDVTNLASDGHSDPNNYLLFAVLNSSQSPHFELLNLTIDATGTGGLSLINDGTATPSSGVKIHDIKVQNAANRGFNDNGLVFGVVYSCQFVDNFVQVGSIGAEGNGWAAPFAFGDANNIFVEDNTFTFTSDARRGQILYNAEGGRMVFRHNAAMNVYIDYDIMDFHGNIGTWPANRGTVGGEMYDNIITITAGTYQDWRGFYFRGGQAMVFNNTFKSNTGNGNAYFELTEEDAWQTAFGCPCPIHDTVANSYFWNNTMNGAEQVPFVSNPPSGSYIALNSQYWTPDKGSAAARPATCTSGALYGTTDTDMLYRCASTNSWSVAYQPYTYPHPLRSAQAPQPQAPSSLWIIP